MDAKRGIAKNTIYQMLAKVFSAGGTLIGTVLITRLLGAETFGEYSVVTAFVLSFYILSDFGVNAVTAREFSKDESYAKGNFASILVFRLMVGFLLLALALVVLRFMPYSIYIKRAILVGLTLIIFQSAFAACTTIFQAHLGYKYYFFSVVAGNVVTLLALGFAVLSNWGLTCLAASLVLGSFVQVLLSLIFVRRFLAFSRSIVDYSLWRRTLLASLPLGMGLLLNTAMVQADRFLLSILSTPYSVGVYNLSYKIFDFVLVFPTFFMNAAFPMFVRLEKESERRFRESFRKSVAMLSAASIFVTVLGVLLAPVLVPLIWGFRMSAVVVPLSILISGSLIFFVTSPLSWLLVIRNKQRFLPYIYSVALIFNVAFNVIFIPKYDYIASAVLTVLSELIVLVGLVLVSKKLVCF